MRNTVQPVASSGVSFNLDLVEREDIPWRSFEFAATGTSDARGSSLMGYGLEPIKWFNMIVEAAKRRMVMQPLVRQATLKPGEAQGVMPIHDNFIKDSSWETSVEEYSTANTDITPTTLDTFDGVPFDPVDEHYAIFLANKALRRNANDKVRDARTELTERLSYVVDDAIFTAIRPASGGDVTEMTNSANGLQTIFGGSATTAGDSLNTGDVLTTKMIRKSKKLLNSPKGRFWSGDSFTKSAVEKNPWANAPDGKYYGIISSDDEEALTGQSQFNSAAQYGDDKIVKDGYIGRFHGFDFVVSDLLKNFSSGDDAYVQGATTSMDIDAHEVYFVKANYFAGLMWGLQPKWYVYDHPEQYQKRIQTEMAYKVKPLHSDAIVRAIVADQ